MERLILKFELDRKQMISANDRLHFQKKAKITKFLRQLAYYEGRNILLDYFGLPFNEKKPCKVIVWIFAPTNRKYDLTRLFRAEEHTSELQSRQYLV